MPAWTTSPVASLAPGGLSALVRLLGSLRRAGPLVLLTVAGVQPALAQAQASPMCAAQIVRFMAIRSGSSESASPQQLFEVMANGEARSRASAMGIKGAIARGELPMSAQLRRPGGEWVALASAPDLAPLPARPDEPGLPGLAMGCWVSDPYPFQEGPTTVVFLLDGFRGYYFAAFLNDGNVDGELLAFEYGHPYEVRDIAGDSFSVFMPGSVSLSQQITGFPGVAARMVDPQTLEVRMNGGRLVIFRRM